MAAAAFQENPTDMGGGASAKNYRSRAGQPFQNKSQRGRERDQLGKLVCSGEHSHQDKET